MSKNLYIKKHKDRNINDTHFINQLVRVHYFLSNGNRLENKNDFECNIFEYYYVIISMYDYIYIKYTMKKCLMISKFW